jgi:hypothetical protein
MSGSGKQNDGQRSDHGGGQTCLADAAGGDAGTGRKQPHPPTGQGRPQPHAARGASVGGQVRAVANPNTGAHHEGGGRPGRRGDQRCEPRRSGAGARRVSQPTVRNERRERKQRQSQRRAGGADEHAAPLKPASPVNARPELVHVGQPRAAEGGGRQADGLERIRLDDLCRGQRERDADQLVGSVAHEQQRSRVVGRLGNAQPGRRSGAPGAERGGEGSGG